MALATDRLLFLHIPKCSGVFIRQAISACGIPWYEVGEQHSHFPELLRYQNEDFYHNKFILACVRHPLTWYQSRWAFRLKHGWRMQHPLDYNCAANNFHTFIDNVLRYKPSGWATWEYNNYLDAVPGGIDFVARTETVVTDIIDALRLAGEPVNDAAIRNLPRLNDSDLDGWPSHYWARYSDDLMRRVLAVDSDIIARYYFDQIVDPYSLCGPAPY